MKLSHNIIYSCALTVSGYLVPMITYPYISRVLGVANIGLCNFIDGIINYFTLFSMMGIGVVGIREVAANKDDRHGLSQCFRDLMAFNIFLTFVAGIVLLAATFLFPGAQEYRGLLLVGAVKLIANTFLVEWFYKGLENFKYITLRSVLVKSLYVVAVFMFVKAPGDYAVYYWLTTLVCVANAAVNWRHLCLFVSLRAGRFRLLRYAGPILFMGCYGLLTSMYSTFNIVYLGAVAGVTEVGYYTTATKLFSFIIALFTAFTSVMLPRMSALLNEGRRPEFNRLAALSNTILFRMAFPLIVFTMFFAPQIVYVISGPGYAPAAGPLRIVLPLIFIIGYEQILIIQMLMPMKKDRAVFVNSIIGAVVGVVLNVLLTSRLGCTGSAIVWLCSECAVMLSAQYFIYRYLRRGFPFRLLLRELLYCGPILALFAGLWLIPDSAGVVKVVPPAVVMAGYSLAVFMSLKKSLKGYALE